MTIADRLRKEDAMQGKHEEALCTAQEMMEKGLDHEVTLMLTRLSSGDPIAPDH